MKYMNQKLMLFVGLLFYAQINYGQKVVSQADIVYMALKNSSNIKAASLAIKQQKQLLKASYNIPNTELFIESPTGNFYSTSLLQTFEFPTVYTNQYKLQKEKVTLAEKEQVLSTNDFAYQVKLIYLQLQINIANEVTLKIQDSVYNKLSTAAARQFDAGQIDYLQKLFAENQFGEIHNKYKEYLTSTKNLFTQLQYFTGMQDSSFLIEPISNKLIGNDFQNKLLHTNAAVQLLQQDAVIAKRNVDLQKSKALPGLAFGYFNQGEKSTIIQNRFRFGITLPLWRGQYKSNIDAAKTAVAISEQKIAGLQQQVSLQMMQAYNEFQLAAQSLAYFESTALKTSNEMINTAKRLFENGESDYINYLRNINDAFAIQLKYLESLNKYQQSILTINYLKGTL